MPPRKSAEIRFWDAVIRPENPDECWGWRLSRDRVGYGQINAMLDFGVRGAHQLSYILHYGAIPDGLVVCHNCKNRDCSNPLHLRADTQSENIRDQLRDYTHTHQKLTLSQVAEIRVRIQNGETLKSIASHFDIDPSAISRIKSGKTFRGL